jgi:hypothetical protein
MTHEGLQVWASLEVWVSACCLVHADSPITEKMMEQTWSSLIPGGKTFGGGGKAAGVS